MTKNQGLMRLVHACQFSWQGLRSALMNEAAFRQEFILFLCLAAVSFFLDISTIERLIMLTSILFIMIVELLNSAIECVVDRVSTERHILSGRAKDYGSLAVLISVLIAIATWLVILLD
jgi:diacylglycerol kinase (ATP)